MSPDAKSTASSKIARSSGDFPALIGLKRYREAVPLLERAVDIFASQKVDIAELGHARFLLAQCWVKSRGDRARATDLARAAASDFEAAGDRSAERLAEVQAWLAAHE